MTTFLLAVLGQPWRREFSRYLRGMAPAAVVGIAYFGGYAILMRSWPGFPPHDISHWTYFFAPALALAAFVPFAPKVVLRTMLLFLTAVTMTALIALPMKAAFPSMQRLHLTIALVALLITAVQLLEGFHTKSIPRRVPSAALASLLVAGIGASATILISGSILHGELAGIACAAFGPFILAAIIWSDCLDYGRAAMVFIFLISALLFTGSLLLDHLPLPCIVLIAGAALLPPVIFIIPKTKSMASAGRILSRVVWTVIPAVISALFAAASVAIAIRASPPMDM